MIQWQIFNRSDDYWNHLLLNSDTPSFFQTSNWGNHKETFGWRARKYVAKLGSEVIAVTQLLTRSKLGVGIAWAPGGISFLAATPDIKQMRLVLDSAAKYFQNRFPTYLIRFNLHQAKDLEDSIISSGFYIPLSKLVPAQSRLIHCNIFDLNLCSSHTKRQVHRAYRNQFEWCTNISEKNIRGFVSLIKNTSTRNKITLPLANSRNINSLITHLDRDQFVLLIGRLNGIEVTGCLILISGISAFYYASGSSHLGYQTSANYALMIRLISILRDRGVTRLDFGGIGTKKHLQGINRFKSGFHSESNEKIGEKEISKYRVLRLMTNAIISIRGA